MSLENGSFASAGKKFGVLHFYRWIEVWRQTRSKTQIFFPTLFNLPFLNDPLGTPLNVTYPVGAQISWLGVANWLYFTSSQLWVIWVLVMGLLEVQGKNWSFGLLEVDWGCKANKVQNSNFFPYTSKCPILQGNLGCPSPTSFYKCVLQYKGAGLRSPEGKIDVYQSIELEHGAKNL